MPIYRYKCKKCEASFEVIHGIDVKQTSCNLCGSEQINKLLLPFRKGTDKDERKELAKERIDRYIQENKQENKSTKRKDLE